MKNIWRLWAFLLLALSFPLSSLAQITFEKTYGGIYYDWGFSVQQTVPDEGYIITGFTSSFGAGSGDVYLIRTDSLGETLWTRTYGGSYDDWGFSVQQTSDGGYIIVGSTESFGAGMRDVYLIKTDSLGDTLWTRTYGGADDDHGWSVQQTSDEGYIITGGTWSFGAGWIDVYLIKTDSLGDTLWTRTYGGGNEDEGRSVQETSDGGYIITGFTDSFGGGYLIKTDSLGDTLWTRIYGADNRSVLQTSDGGYIIGGDGWFFTSDDVFLIKTDSLGDSLWEITYGGANNDEGRSVQQTSDGGYIIAGASKSFGDTLGDVYLIKTDSTGNALWTKAYGGTDEDDGWSVRQTSDGGFIIAGGTFSLGAGFADVYLIKTDSLGNVLVGVEEEEDLRLNPEHDSGGDLRFELLQNHPNPFHFTTLIRYEIPLTPFNKGGAEGGGFTKGGIRGIPVSLAIYDITGRLVETLVNEGQEPGVYQVEWEGKNQASGIYFYRLTVEGLDALNSFQGIQGSTYTATKKLILLR